MLKSLRFLLKLGVLPFDPWVGKQFKMTAVQWALQITDYLVSVIAAPGQTYIWRSVLSTWQHNTHRAHPAPMLCWLAALIFQFLPIDSLLTFSDPCKQSLVKKNYSSVYINIKINHPRGHISLSRYLCVCVVVCAIVYTYTHLYTCVYENSCIYIIKA